MALKLQIERVEGRREQQSSWVVIQNLRLLVCLQSQLCLMFTGNVPPNSVVPSEGTRAEWAWDTNALMTLPNVSS